MREEDSYFGSFSTEEECGDVVVNIGCLVVVEVAVALVAVALDTAMGILLRTLVVVVTGFVVTKVAGPEDFAT